MKDFINQNIRKISFTLLALLIICTAVLYYFDLFLKTQAAPNGIVSFELAQTLSKSQAIMDSWNQQAKTFAGLSLGFDFLYIFVYTVFLALLLYFSLEKINNNKVLYKTGKTLIYLIILAGLFDVIENITLIKLLSGQQQVILSRIAYGAASLKFSIIILGVLLIITNWGYVFFLKRK